MFGRYRFGGAYFGRSPNRTVAPVDINVVLTTSAVLTLTSDGCAVYPTELSGEFQLNSDAAAAWPAQLTDGSFVLASGAATSLLAQASSGKLALQSDGVTTYPALPNFFSARLALSAENPTAMSSQTTSGILIFSADPPFVIDGATVKLTTSGILRLGADPPTVTPPIPPVTLDGNLHVGTVV